MSGFAAVFSNRARVLGEQRALLVSHQAFFNSLHFVIILPVIVAFPLLFIAAAKGRERREKLAATALIVVVLIIIGAPQYILGNTLYSISGVLMSDLDPA